MLFSEDVGHGSPAFFLRQRDTKVTGGWYTGRTWKITVISHLFQSPMP